MIQIMKLLICCTDKSLTINFMNICYDYSTLLKYQSTFVLYYLSMSIQQLYGPWVTLLQANPVDPEKKAAEAV